MHKKEALFAMIGGVVGGVLSTRSTQRGEKCAV